MVLLVEDGVPQARAFSELQYGGLREVLMVHAKGKERCRREPGSALSSGYATRFGGVGGKLDRLRTRGVLSPCARESKARTGRFLREKLIS